MPTHHYHIYSGGAIGIDEYAMETHPPLKQVHFQEYVVIFKYKYNQSPSIMKTSPLIDDRSDHVTPFTIKRQHLKANLHSIHLRRKERHNHP